jgi:hypothetical protein
MVEIGKGKATLNAVQDDLIDIMLASLKSNIGSRDSCKIVSARRTGSSIVVLVRISKELGGAIFDGGLIELRFPCTWKLV